MKGHLGRSFEFALSGLPKVERKKKLRLTGLNWRKAGPGKLSRCCVVLQFVRLLLLLPPSSDKNEQLPLQCSLTPMAQREVVVVEETCA